MTQILAQWLLSALLLLATAYLVPGFKLSGFIPALIAAVVVGFFNATLWWLLMFLALPLTILTLGLFVFVVNAAILKISSAFVPGFEIKGWIPGIIGAVVLAIGHALMRSLMAPPPAINA